MNWIAQKIWSARFSNLLSSFFFSDEDLLRAVVTLVNSCGSLCVSSMQESPVGKKKKKFFAYSGKVEAQGVTVE
jgi:hypothetical protein